jgi:prepilin-type N-terminal cleavage/methylation domain-containing protein/prepilin-type processing-associated H-X9-DG protein
MMMRRRGFTLIELLVVIAIIGILAAMLFPVFARARESARKIQCLSNVKNIAIAINMYLTDWDRFWPGFHDAVAQGWFDDNHPGGKGTAGNHCSQAGHANPYLQVAVILDEYVKNRDVWRCPSAKIMNGAAVIVPMGRNGYWLNEWIDNTSWEADRPIGPCYTCWPPGWGGAITDSFGQGNVMAATTATGASSEGQGVFVQGVGINNGLDDMTTAAVDDPARWVACGDTGKQVEFWETEGVALPDTCASNGCGGLTYAPSTSGPCPDTCAGADWANCPQSRQCGLTPEAHHKLLTDSNYRKGYARHLGGSNVGFTDGHAKWMPMEALLTGAEPFPNPILQGICSCWPGNPKCY